MRCGLDPAVFERTADDAPAREETRLICVGRLVHHKGHAVLLEAVAELERAGVPVRAIVVGDGPKRARLERLARRLRIDDRVVFTGGVGQDRIRDLYAGADICCLPSFAEGIPVVLMEAMAVGLPVVTSRIMGIPELVEDGTNGLLVPPGRPTELARALQRLIGDPALRRRMGAAGRERVVADFDVNRSAETLSGIFRRELGRA